jgi:hypothetical protein
MASRIHGLQDHCGSGLARDDIAAVYLPDHVVCIAGKPAPTGYAWPAEFTACRIIVGAGLLAMISLRCTCQTVLSASQVSQLPQVMHGQQNSRLARIPCGSGLARDGIAAQYLPDRVVCVAGKPAPTSDGVRSPFGASWWASAASVFAQPYKRTTQHKIYPFTLPAHFAVILSPSLGSSWPSCKWRRSGQHSRQPAVATASIWICETNVIPVLKSGAQCYVVVSSPAG